MSTPSSRRRQYEYELRLREQVLNSSINERAAVYTAVYADLFSNFPDHSVFIPDEERQKAGRIKASLLLPLLSAPSDVLEIGCGRGDVLVEFKRRGHSCTGTEPSQEMIELCSKDIQVLIGCAHELDFPDSSFDMVFSQQVLEHLHPDDVPIHFKEAYRVLRHGGIFATESPNPTTGPQDVSRGFTKTAQGLHLKEWSVKELLNQYKLAGFKNIKGLLAPPFLVRRVPILHKISRVPGYVKWLQDGMLKLAGC